MNIGIGILSLIIFLQACAAPRSLYSKREEICSNKISYEKDYYEYPAFELKNFSKEWLESKKRFQRFQIEFDLLFPQDLISKNSNEIRAEIDALKKNDVKKARNQELTFRNRLYYYLPRDLEVGEKRPIIIISPILGGNMIVDWFAEYYAKRGMIAIIVHRQKLYWQEGEGLEQIEDYMRISLIRIRQAMDWVLSQPEVDSEKVGSFGISYGAIMHTMLAAVEDRIDYHILAMPAGPLPEVILNCPEKGIRSVMESAQKDLGFSKEELIEALRSVLKTDPYLLASQIDTEKVEVYASLFDRVVRTKNIFNLWREMREPSLSLIPMGHYGGVLILPWLQKKSYSSFKRIFKEKTKESLWVL